MSYFKLGSILKSDKKIFDFLYQSNYHRSYGVAYNITLNKEAAEDIVQGAFERAFQRFDDIKDVDHFVKWLMVTTTNLAIDEVRKNRRYLLVEEVKENTEIYPDFNPEPAVLKEEQKKDVIKAIHSLKPHYRIVVYLKYYCNLSYREMSEKLKVSESTLRIRSHRALHQIKQILESSPNDC